jgi:hypothetical protein
MLSGSGAEGFHGRRARNSQRKREPSGDRQRAAGASTSAGRASAATRVATAATERRHERSSVAAFGNAAAASEPGLGSAVAAEPTASTATSAPKSSAHTRGTLERSAPTTTKHAARDAERVACDAERSGRDTERGAGLHEPAPIIARAADSPLARRSAELRSALGCAANPGAAR